jgi:hypothetical protein
MNPRDKSRRPLWLRVAERQTPMSLGVDQRVHQWPTWGDHGRPLRLGSASASMGGWSTAFDRLCQQAVQCAAPGVQEVRRICESVRELRSICLDSLAETRTQARDLAELFDQLLISSTDPEFRRLAAIHKRYLEPVITRHFDGSQRQQLERSLKTLIVLRLLRVPYRSGCPISAGEEESLLSSLYVLCRGAGLMVWDEGSNPVYVVETDHERFVEWIITRMTAFLGRNDRDKAMSDALWSTMFSCADRGGGQGLSPAGSQARLLLLSGGGFSGREAVLVQWPGAGEWVLVFESPWEADRGRRVHQVMMTLPGGILPSQVWIWVPRQPSPSEEERITCYMATARALRQTLSGENAEETGGWLVHALQHPYLRASPPALKATIDCYRQGTVITDRGAWRPGEHTGSLVHLVGKLVAWASRENESQLA